MKKDTPKISIGKNHDSLKIGAEDQVVPTLTPYTLLCGLVRIAATLYGASSAVMWSAEQGGRGALVSFYGLSDNDATSLDADAYDQSVDSPPLDVPDTGRLYLVDDVIGGMHINGETMPGCRIMVLNTEPIPADLRLEGIIRILADQATALIGLPRREVITRTTLQKVSRPESSVVAELDGQSDTEDNSSQYDGFLEIFDAHPIPAFIFDRASLNILAVNNAVIEQYGYSQDELVGMNIRAMRPPEDITRLEMSVTRGQDGKNSRWTHIKKNGERITVQVDRADVSYQDIECVLITAQDITARVATENELKASQERFRLVTENISDMIMMIDHDGNVRYVSPASSRLLGILPEDLVGSHFIERIHNDDESRVIDALLEGFVEKGVSKPIEFRLKHASGEWLKFEAVANNQFSTPGLDAIVVAVRDITKQERDASQLHLREQALETVANGVVIVDARQPDMPIVYVNKAFESITGYSYDDVNKRNLRFLNDGDRDQSELQRLRDAIKYEREATVVLRNFRKDGTEFWNELHISPIYDSSGILTHYVGVQTDITERKQAIETLADTEERYRVIVGGSAHVVWVCDKNGNDIPSLNTRSLLSPVSRKSWMDQIHPDDRTLVQKTWTQAIAAKEHRECEHRVLRDGDYRVVISKAMPLLDSSGNVREWIGLSMDITQQRKVQTQVVQKEKLAALGELVAGVASEISRPLGAIASAAKHLETSIDSKTIKTGSTMLTLTRRIEGIVDSLSVFARQGDDARSEANLNHAILSVAGALRFDLKRANIKIELDVDESLPNTRFNVSQIEKMLINLIENSIYSLKSSDDKKRLIRISTGIDHLDSGQPCAFASITDTGVGIDSDSLVSVFDPFFTTKSDDDSVGLGLSICHGIARAHGGTIDVESSLGHGATFVVRLPLDDIDSIARPLAA